MDLQVRYVTLHAPPRTPSHPNEHRNMTQDSICEELDVRPILARGEDPRALLLATLAGRARPLRVIAPFRPGPLIARMQAEGRQVHEAQHEGAWRIWIGPAAAQAGADPAPGAPPATAPPPPAPPPGVAPTPPAVLPLPARLPSGLRPEQGPPLWVPVCFFGLAPLGMSGAGAVALATPALLGHPRAGPALALVHLLTLGALLPALIGALLQLIPVLGGVPVPGARHLPWATVPALALGGAAFVVGALGGPPAAWRAAALLVGGGALLALGPAAWALARAPGSHPSVAGMRLGLGALAAAVALGALLALARAGAPHPGLAWVVAHLALAGAGGVGGLVLAVSWTVVPMFYMTPAWPAQATRAARWGLGLGLLGPVVAAWAAPGRPGLALLAALPATGVVWGLAPAVLLWQLQRRRRRRVDPSARAWQGASVSALLGLALAMLAAGLGELRLGQLAGWVLLWGWASLTLHGMLSRVVAFLVWMHTSAHGLPAPALAALWPPARLRRGLALHTLTLGLGVAALWSAWTPLAWLTGLGLAATGVGLLADLRHALAPALRAPASPQTHTELGGPDEPAA